LTHPYHIAPLRFHSENLEMFHFEAASGNVIQILEEILEHAHFPCLRELSLIIEAFGASETEVDLLEDEYLWRNCRVWPSGTYDMPTRLMDRLTKVDLTIYNGLNRGYLKDEDAVRRIFGAAGEGGILSNIKFVNDDLYKPKDAQLRADLARLEG
jgi:hypothetical protein